MVILVNHYSASASEIVSACLQDHKRAVIVGERTWGKGSVQNIIELENGRSALKLTTAAYQRPSGKNIHRFPDSKVQDEWGVMPDAGWDLYLNDRETNALLVDRRDRDVLLPHVSLATKPSQAANSATPPEDSATPSKAVTPAALKIAVEPDKAAVRVATAPDVVPRSVAPATPAAADPKSAGPAKAKKSPFVDRQLQLALKYLNDQLARAK